MSTSRTTLTSLALHCIYEQYCIQVLYSDMLYHDGSIGASDSVLQ